MAVRKRRNHAPTFKAQVALALKGSNMLILDVRMIMALPFDCPGARMAGVLRIAAAHFTQPDRQLRPRCWRRPSGRNLMQSSHSYDCSG